MHQLTNQLLFIPLLPQECQCLSLNAAQVTNRVAETLGRSTDTLDTKSVRIEPIEIEKILFHVSDQSVCLKPENNKKKSLNH